MKKNLKYLGIILAVLIVLAVVAIAFPMLQEHFPGLFHSSTSAPQILTVTTIEEILNVSDLSTFEAVYNGVSTVTNPDNPDKVDYYVSYEAKVSAGLDFSKIKIEIDTENKAFNITLPPIQITDVSVDIGSLDAIFINKNANKGFVLETAYNKCKEDVTAESKCEDKIISLAKQNAENVIRALISPFISQLGNDYVLIIK